MFTSDERLFPCRRAPWLAKALAARASGGVKNCRGSAGGRRSVLQLARLRHPLCQGHKMQSGPARALLRPGPGQNSLSRHQDFASEVVFFYCLAHDGSTGKDWEEGAPLSHTHGWDWEGFPPPGSSAAPSRLATGSRPPSRELRGAQLLGGRGNVPGLAIICKNREVSKTNF